jgi:2'-5' RNA ligase
MRSARLGAIGAVGVPRRRPRLFALDLEDRDKRAAFVQQTVSQALAKGGWYEPEKRPFWPHITFARVSKGAPHVAPIHQTPPQEPFTAATVTLYRSHLSPRGAHYEALAQARLLKGAQGR